MIDIKFRNMESTVSNIVETKLEEKKIGAGNKTYAQAVNADLAKHESTTNGQLVENLRNVIRESKNEEISEEKEKKETRTECYNPRDRNKYRDPRTNRICK